MSESSNGETEKKFGPQDQGIKETRTFRDRLKSGQTADDLRDKLNNTTTDRRSLIAGGTVLAITSAVAASNLLRRNQEKRPSQAAPTPEVESSHPHLVMLARNENGELGFSENPDVAQYIAHPQFSGINSSPNVRVRTEIDTTNDETIIDGVLARELEDANLGVIRVGGFDFKAYNDMHNDPQFCFKTTNKDHVEKFEYLWLAFATKVEENPTNPELYIDDADGTRSIQLVDHTGNYVDRGHSEVISPIYVDTTGN
jgi:hypothetical protein